MLDDVGCCDGDVFGVCLEASVFAIGAGARASSEQWLWLKQS